MSSRRVRQHVNPLRSDLLSIDDVPRVEGPPGASLEVELGSAEAHFLMDRAVETPDRHYVGIEIRIEMVHKANREAAHRGLAGKVRSVFANISVDMPRLFAPHSVSRFFVNFPDPWFKERQHKRRVIDPSLVDDMLDALVDGGEIYVNTDIFELALDAMQALEMNPGVRNVLSPWTFLRQSVFSSRSRRERQCERDGTKIWRLAYRRA
ncbi:MAG: tRNA (guanosine(46)-N7)-methyltransferase TrmB [Myxococcales bacterium]|nr:tRNA (guanosine(46)-N7)-methyltransferase TrmB [Myxococcales bacterium]